MMSVAQYAGKAVQTLPLQIVRPLEKVLVSRAHPDEPVNLISVVGPPRIGSTLAYILLARAFNVSYISNLEHVFFKVPAVGAAVKRVLVGRYRGGYESDLGYVPGLNAPAEANRFWEYWFDYSIHERPPSPRPERMEYIRRILQTVCSSKSHTLLSAWTAHGFYIPHNVAFFSNCLFIHLRRDPIDTAISIYNSRIKRYSTDTIWLSLRPVECKAYLGRDPVHQIAAQVHLINKRIEDAKRRYPGAVIDHEYRLLCESPGSFVKHIHDRAHRLGISLQSNENSASPDRFSFSTYRDRPAYLKLRDRFRHAFNEAGDYESAGT